MIYEIVPTFSKVRGNWYCLWIINGVFLLFSLILNGVMKKFELSICLVTDECVQYSLLEIYWNRFLDDCFIILRSSQISPGQLSLTLNSINPSIKFTMEYIKDQIPFLDILLKKSESGIWMDLYHKTADTQKCLPFTSCHANHCKRNISFCLARRISTIAENSAEMLRNLENLKSNLSKYHFSDYHH